MRNNGMGDAGVAALCAGIQAHKANGGPLARMAIGDNPFTDVGMADLAALVKAHQLELVYMSRRALALTVTIQISMCRKHLAVLQFRHARFSRCWYVT